MIGGLDQELQIDSVPSGANLEVRQDETVVYLRTPAIVRLRRGRGHTLLLTKPGFRRTQLILEPSTGIEPFFWGNFLNGVGFLVDFLDGAWLRFDPVAAVRLPKLEGGG
jgi:hypothetical protein